MPVRRQNNWPIGTLEEIKKLGIDPEESACCAPHDEKGQRGCPVWDSCRFDKRDRGGFKGVGPKNVGYHIHLHPSNGGFQKEDFCSCFAFVQSIQPKMEAGWAAENQDKPHDEYAIIAQEGEPIVVQEWSSKVPGSFTDIRLKVETKEIKVPAFPRPGSQPETDFYEKMNARAARRKAMEKEVFESRHDELERRKRELIEQSAEVEEIDEEVLKQVVTATTQAVAEPIPPKGK